ncbi:MAG: adenosylcobinamide-phosphate synthase CbiB [Methylobacter sp.]|uniref:Cobalamin biosynthesis protein CobD n=1 Tax=Candidatus Methylobacter titanis TaxID=3053457 RepID=A0AA43Q7N1_9GAMM|nr:adenosylcobinamide-phosphate synthase CbiB [Candidatus Methylobacter titanis]
MFFELAILAYLVDLFFGEFPCKHPVVWMGDFISAFERRFYRDRILPGALLVTGLIALTLLISTTLVYLCGFLPAWMSLIILAIFASTGLAMNMLHASVAALLTAKQPKQALRYLVSRDTEDMSDTQIYKAGLETWAENLSDGVIAPLFYLLLFGLPGIAVYKAINTMDSMIAYKTERYFYFGKTAAIVDDIANYIPARLTALLIVSLATDKQRAWQCLRRDGKKMESPNAGYPIAAMAGALGVALGGDARYHGQVKHKPTLGLPIHPVDKSALNQALQMKMGINIMILALLAIGVGLS